MLLTLLTIYIQIHYKLQLSTNTCNIMNNIYMAQLHTILLFTMIISTNSLNYNINVI